MSVEQVWCHDVLFVFYLGFWVDFYWVYLILKRMVMMIMFLRMEKEYSYMNQEIPIAKKLAPGCFTFFKRDGGMSNQGDCSPR